MEEIISELFEKILNSKDDLQFIKNNEGDIIIHFTKKNYSEEINKIKSEIEEMDDDIFIESANLLKDNFTSDFEVLQTLESKNPNIEYIMNSYEVFKSCVEKVLNNKIVETQNLIIENQNKLKEYKKELSKLN